MIVAFVRPGGSAKREMQAALIAVLASIALGSILMLIAGNAPGGVWWTMVTRTVSDPYAIGQLIYKATALMLTGLAVSIALDVGLFNIGGEAQLGAGVLACAIVGTSLPAGTPSIIAVGLCTLAAAAAGGAIGALIGILRVTRGAHEIITSIMLNAIVASTSLWLGNAILFQGGTTRGATIIPAAELPRLGIAGSAANSAVVLALAMVALIWWLRSRTTWGRAWYSVGSNPEAARTVGISVGRTQILTMTAAGALAGLAATSFVLGHKHAFENELGRGTGLLGISVALLGRSHPVGVALAALLLAFLSTGGLQVSTMVPKELTEMLQGLVVLAVAASAVYVRRFEVRT
jgi:simple sugar transport system permease protein